MRKFLAKEILTAYRWQLRVIPDTLLTVDIPEEVIAFIKNIDELTSKISWNDDHVVISYLLPVESRFIVKGLTEFVTTPIIKGISVNILSKENEVIMSLSGRVKNINNWHINFQTEKANNLELVVCYDIATTTFN